MTNTIHTSRTIMVTELSKVMDYSIDNDSYLESLSRNVTGKKSNSGVAKTANYLKRLYGFDLMDPLFAAFRYFWKFSEANEKPLLAFVYAVYHDDLLAESVQVLRDTKRSEKATIESFEEVIEKHHSNQYSSKTRRSVAQNIASSWKQAGFIEGKVKNIRTQPEIGYRIACFAFLSAYLKGDRGDFIWHSNGVNAFCLNETRLRELAIDCAKRDLIQYQYAGSVTVISFNNLIKKIGIDAI